MTDNNAKSPAAGWVGYDGECAFCLRWLRRVEQPLRRRGFDFVSLQARWERRHLAGEFPYLTTTRQRDAGAPGPSVFTEMILDLPDGRTLGGADAAVVLMRYVWWLWPLWLLSRIPGMMPVYRVIYRHIAANRHCANGACSLGSNIPAIQAASKPKRRSHRATAFFELP